MTKKGYNTLGAPKNKWIVTFIDDLNMPIVDKFGDQPPLELLRYINENSNYKIIQDMTFFQIIIISFKDGFQDTTKCIFKSLSDVTFIVSCDPPSSGRHVISQRLLRQFCIFALPGMYLSSFSCLNHGVIFSEILYTNPPRGVV